MVIHCYAPHIRDAMEYRSRWNLFYCGEPKKVGYGIKLSIGVSVEDHPRLVWVNVAPASIGDGKMEMGPNGLFSHLKLGETVLTDGGPEYQGSLWCQAPPHKRMLSFVLELDKIELSLQRGVERFNRWVRSWGVCSGTFRIAPSERGFYQKVASCAITCVRLISVDQRLHGGEFY